MTNETELIRREKLRQWEHDRALELNEAKASRHYTADRVPLTVGMRVWTNDLQPATVIELVGYLDGEPDGPLGRVAWHYVVEDRALDRKLALDGSRMATRHPMDRTDVPPLDLISALTAYARKLPDDDVISVEEAAAAAGVIARLFRNDDPRMLAWIAAAQTLDGMLPPDHAAEMEAWHND